MNKIIHRSEERGDANHGWLHSRHSFSFSNYYNPDKTNFGLLRVLNDDIVAGGAGFGMHGHDNMEIVSIPLHGELEHKDSMGNTEVIRSGEVQIMSAGTGIRHSEYNHSQTEEVNFLQIWVFPKERNITPRYEQKMFAKEERKNKFVTVVSPEHEGSGVWINQDAYFSLGTLDAGAEAGYMLKNEKQGVYIFVVEGSVMVGGETLNRRDAMGISGTNSISLKAITDVEVLVIEIPM